MATATALRQQLREEGAVLVEPVVKGDGTVTMTAFFLNTG
jgi:hypothetical protein